MRPTATTPSALEQPLNILLGTETNVRVLRVLARTAAPLGKSEVARRAELNDSGVRRALGGLMRFGVVKSVSGGVQTVALRDEHYLVDILRELFEAERRSYQRVIDALRRASREVSPPPLSAWVEGVSGYDADAGALVLTVVVHANRAAAAAEQLADGVRRLRHEFELRVSPRILTRADVAAGVGPSDGADLTLLVGPHPDDLVGGRGGSEPTGKTASGHAHHDTRQLRFAAALAARLLDDPELIERAIRDLAAKVTPDTPATDPGREWLDILEHESPAAIRRLLIDPGETATRLRQSLPFTDVLSDAEREELMREARNDEE